MINDIQMFWRRVISPSIYLHTVLYVCGVPVVSGLTNKHTWEMAVIYLAGWISHALTDSFAYGSQCCIRIIIIINIIPSSWKVKKKFKLG